MEKRLDLLRHTKFCCVTLLHDKHDKHVRVSICQNIIFSHTKATLLYASNERKSRRSKGLNVTPTVKKH